MHFGTKLICHLGFLFGWLFHTAVFANNTLNFAVNSPGAAPYIYYNPTTLEYQGLIVDIISNWVSQEHAQVNYIDSHRNRTEFFIYQGLIDGTLASRTWLTHPEKLISTISIIEHKTYLYSLTPFPDNFKLAELNDVNFCTRRGYFYPELAESINLQKIQRIDATDQLAMLHMLTKQRCAYTLMHEHTANILLSSVTFNQFTIYQSAQPSNVVNLAIFLRPELVTFKKGLDSVITSMKKDGSLAASLKRHMMVQTN
jgi:ABC-type amino acid transport substrate-binding protein